MNTVDPAATRAAIVEDGAMNVKQAAAWSGISKSTLYELINAGTLPCSLVRGRMLVPRKALVELIAAGLKGPVPEK